MTEKKKEEAPPVDEPPKDEPPAPPVEEPPAPPVDEPPAPPVDDEEEPETKTKKKKAKKDDSEEYEYVDVPDKSKAIGLPTSKLFWIVTILMILNIVILAASKGGSFGKIMDGLKQLSKVFWIETVIIIAFGAIPGVNVIVLFLAIPVFFFNVWTKLAPLLIDFNKAGAVSGVVPPGSPLTSSNSIPPISNTPDDGSLRSNRKTMMF